MNGCLAGSDSKSLLGESIARPGRPPASGSSNRSCGLFWETEGCHFWLDLHLEGKHEASHQKRLDPLKKENTFVHFEGIPAPK